MNTTEFNLKGEVAKIHTDASRNEAILTISESPIGLVDIQIHILNMATPKRISVIRKGGFKGMAVKEYEIYVGATALNFSIEVQPDGKISKILDEPHYMMFLEPPQKYTSRVVKVGSGGLKLEETMTRQVITLTFDPFQFESR
jgi:hypothetical protein